MKNLVFSIFSPKTHPETHAHAEATEFVLENQRAPAKRIRKRSKKIAFAGMATAFWMLANTIGTRSAANGGHSGPTELTFLSLIPRGAGSDLLSKI